MRRANFDSDGNSTTLRTLTRRAISGSYRVLGEGETARKQRGSDAAFKRFRFAASFYKRHSYAALVNVHLLKSYCRRIWPGQGWFPENVLYKEHKSCSHVSSQRRWSIGQLPSCFIPEAVNP